MCRNILHLFQWKLADIEKNLLTIKQQGFNSILISPVQPFKNELENNWYWCYQPLSFSIGNKYGTKEELKKLCDVSHKLGIEVYIDVVVTHVAGVSLYLSLPFWLFISISFWDINRMVPVLNRVPGIMYPSLSGSSSR